jgi:alpha-L-arabinofuranosidase
VAAAVSRQSTHRPIYIAWDEWNVWYRARGNSQRGRRILEERYDLEDVMVVATFLNSFVNHAHIIKIANMAQFVNVIAPMFTNEQGMFLQTIYFPLQLFANHTKGKALQLYVDSPHYKTARYDGVPYLDVLVNRHKDQPIEAEIESQDKQFTGAMSISEVNGPDIKSENDFGKTTVRTVERSSPAEGKKIRYTFPAPSFTMLKGKLA